MKYINIIILFLFLVNINIQTKPEEIKTETYIEKKGTDNG